MRALAIAFAFLTLPLLVFGQGARHDNVAYQFISNGNSNMIASIPNAPVTICNGNVLPAPGNTCTGLATVYSDDAMTNALQNPINADGFGNYGFYAPAGSYIVSVSGAGLTTYSYPLKMACTLDGNCTFTGNITFTGTVNIPGGTSLILPLPLTKDTFTHHLTAVTTTAARTWTLQDTSDTFVFLNTTDILTNKTIDISANALKNSTNTAGHYPRNNGGGYVDSAILVGDLPFTYQGNTTKVFTCTGSFTPGHTVSTDASGNCIDSGVSSTLIIKGASAAGCNTGGGSNSACEQNIIWNGGDFADATYFYACSGQDPNAFIGQSTTNTNPVLTVSSHTAHQITVSTETSRSLAAQYSQISCIGIHF